ncbi:MAG TPA: hypothetical protein PLD47_08610 [Aggregatilineales bacterium]|nr:hypothetical protein [Anaerolineales bacterium]HRE47773.1 hypothetical protein [Aggregatilineales bacterium]
MSNLFGRWVGSAEVYNGEGRFVGNGMDMRTVQSLGGGLTRIDVAFVGLFKAAGHSLIRDQGTHRLYEGPVNVGYADVLADSVAEATGYWACVGLSPRFFLMTLPDRNKQLSLALMSRGESLLYIVVGENHRRIDHGIDVVGEGITQENGAILGVGRWMRFGYDFLSFGIMTNPTRQITGGVFHRGNLWQPMAWRGSSGWALPKGKGGMGGGVSWRKNILPPPPLRAALPPLVVRGSPKAIARSTGQFMTL